MYSGMYKLRPCGFKDCAPCNMDGYESREMDAVQEYLDRVAALGELSGVFVDVGAHTGLWSLFMSELYQLRYCIKPTIYALEPDADNAATLLQNAKQDDTGIVAVRVAAWNRSEQLGIMPDENPGRHRVTSSSRPDLQRVQAVALDDVAKTPAQRAIDAIKIDVEGAELQVLNGARGILTENERMLVVVEYSIGNAREFGYHPDQITRFMQAHGFRAWREQDKTTIDTIAEADLKRVIFVKGELD